MIANSMGLDSETFEEILEDFITDASELSLNISKSLEGDDLQECRKNTLVLKGMSESIQLKSFDTQIACLIESNDKQEMIEAVQMIDKIISKIAKKV